MQLGQALRIGTRCMTGCFWRDKCAMRCFRFLGGKSHKTLTGFPMFTPAVTDAENSLAMRSMAKSNHGAPGIDGVTFEAIEESGAEGFLCRFGMNWSLTRIGPCRHGRRKFQRMGQESPRPFDSGDS